VGFRFGPDLRHYLDFTGAALYTQVGHAPKSQAGGVCVWWWWWWGGNLGTRRCHR
jgi:hypothetical protein